ncbi:MAG: ABC transporter substrate-binding protein [Rhodothermales bacterium]
MNRVLGCPFFLRKAGLVVFGAMMFAACTRSGPETPPDTPPDASLDAPHTGSIRIAPLAPSVTEMVWLVGGRAALAGVTTADDFPPGIQGLPTYSALPIDYEAIVVLEPDVVIGTHQVNAPRDMEAFEVLGIPVELLENRSIEDLLEAILQIGTLLDQTDRARFVADSLQSRLDALDTVVEGTRRPSALFLISSSTSWSFGPESHIHELMEYAGFASITANFDTEAPVLSDEFVIQAAPDYIFGSFSDEHPLEALLEHHPAWRHVPAVANGRVFRIDPDLALRPGPRAIQAAWDMAAIRQATPGS